jgi:hypothetical protein
VRVLFFLLLIFGAASAAYSKTNVVLPVAPGVSGGGPWTVEEWSNDGCLHCNMNQADFGALRAFVGSLKKDTHENFADPNLTMVIVRGGQNSGTATVADLQDMLDGCKVGSAGMLSPNHTTDLVAFGVRFDCEKTHHASFMSVVMGKDHSPSAVYWLPDGPIYAVDQN